MNVDKLDTYVYEITPKTLMARVSGRIMKFQMKVPVHIYVNEQILNEIQKDRTLEQISNVACLPGIAKHAIALSDAHQGYGFCIGTVAGTYENEGLISPGGVGYDINCGVRLLRTNLDEKEVREVTIDLLNKIYTKIPSGLGSKGKIKITNNNLDRLIENGLNWTLEKNYAIENDLICCEDKGCLEGANANLVSNKAKKRGISQLGSLGSGNHFIEIQKVETIYNERIAKVMGINRKGQIMLMIHTGSRAFGHQICTDSIRTMEKAMKDYEIYIPDRELSGTLANSNEAQNYLSQMACAANFGFCNRQIITYWIRKAFEEIFNQNFEDLDINLIYDVCHNILKKEEHEVNGKKEKLNIHRKGATRAFPPGHPVLPMKYKTIGQPVLIPGTMGSASYLCVGKEESMNLTFGSTAHGAGRVMSRSKASKNYWGKDVQKELMNKGVYIKASSLKIIAEEAPEVYKDINQIIKISEHLGIIEKIVKLRPIGVVKG
ncbi:MAG: RNA-splicing ligase RtcB [Candidatus Lokiarchaeota archaeon]|nr:RNA-splicing ligase RtcB [Candidatus Lokiarchaeota archaeon]MBD3201872.1 RNA-splicing ligase RtcB [Candidatus Lokiarchaeota archaeon]